MNRDRILDKKSKQLTQELADWAAKHQPRLLGPGERIVFSMRVEKGPIVERDKRDSPGYAEHKLNLSTSVLAGGYKFIEVATPTSPEIEQLIVPLSKDCRSFMRELLIEQRNNPYSAGQNFERVRIAINKTIGDKVFAGKRYRLVGQFDGEEGSYVYQLWVVEGERNKYPVSLPQWDKPVTAEDMQLARSADLQEAERNILERVLSAGTEGLPTYEGQRMTVESGQIKSLNKVLRTLKQPLEVRDCTSGAHRWITARFALTHVERKMPE